MASRKPKINKDVGRKPRKLNKDNAEIRRILHDMESRMHFCDNYEEKRMSGILLNALEQAVENENLDYMNTINVSKMIPVTIDEFIEDNMYLGGLDFEVWDKLREDLRLLKPDIMLGESPIREIYNKSCIGTGKSILGQILILYDLYFTCCFDHPQLIYSNLTPYTPILFILQSIRPTITDRVLYEPLRSMFQHIPFNKRYVRWNKDRQSTLVLENNVHLIPMVADPNAYLGQAILGGHIDEANFMEVVKESKRIAGPGGMGGLYDQAEMLYENITTRRLSRFTTNGPDPGAIYLSSSVNYKDDFLNRLTRALTDEDKDVKVLNYRQWEVNPRKFQKDGSFNFLVGTDDYPARIIDNKAKAGVDYPISGLIEKVPNQFKDRFRRNPDMAQREFLGIASSSISRFIAQTHKIAESVVMGRESGLKQFIVNPNIVLEESGKLFEVNEANLPLDKETPRAIHIDLSRTGDRCGIAMSKIMGYTAMNVDGIVEQLPTFGVEMALTIEPSSMYPIDIPAVRRWTMLLKSFYGLNIVLVTYDGFDSRESIQLWRKAGIDSMVISVDKTIEPYEHYKTALYHDRVLMVENNIARQELSQLERIEAGGKSKIDHPPKGSKDLADAIAASIKAVSMLRQNRALNKVTDTSGNKINAKQRRNPGKKSNRRI